MFVRISGFDPLLDVMRAFEAPMQREIESTGHGLMFPAVDVAETEQYFELVAELPGMTREDISISVENGHLTLRGERKHYGFPQGTKVLRHESITQPFTRTFHLPEEVDANRISAELKDGILRIQLPKIEEAKPREIKIR